MVLEVILVVLGVGLVVLGVVLVVLHGAQRQCSEQMFGTDSVRNNVPSQLSLEVLLDILEALLEVLQVSCLVFLGKF